MKIETNLKNEFIISKESISIKLFQLKMNKYEILETIGQGEYGVVLKARNK